MMEQKMFNILFPKTFKVCFLIMIIRISWDDC